MPFGGTSRRRRPLRDGRRHRGRLRRTHRLRALGAGALATALLGALSAGIGAPPPALAATSAAPASPATGSSAASSPEAVALHPPLLRPGVPVTVTVPGALPPLSWPRAGESAAALAGVGLIARSAVQAPVPIASLTKMMTAYVLLRDHPLGIGAQGPSVRISAADVADWDYAAHHDESNVKVVRGEVLSERQLLEALLVPSGDNIADLLAIWDAGSLPAFVAKMNATARALHLPATHYADASGLAVGSRSDAIDQARLAGLLMANPVVRWIVSNPSLPFPVVGRIGNYNPALGHDGVVGLKSGYTGAAGACLVLTAWRHVGGRPVLLVAVSLGQPGYLPGAARAAEKVLATASPLLEPVTLAAPAAELGTLRLPETAASLALGAPSGVGLVGWPGLRLELRLRAAPDALLRRLAAAGATAVPAPTTSGTTAAGPLGPPATLEVDGPAGVVLRTPLASTPARGRSGSGTSGA